MLFGKSEIAVSLAYMLTSGVARSVTELLLEILVMIMPLIILEMPNTQYRIWP